MALSGDFFLAAGAVRTDRRTELMQEMACFSVASCVKKRATRTCNTYALVNSMSMYWMAVSGDLGYIPAHGDQDRHIQLQQHSHT